MSALRLARPIRLVLARLGAILLTLAILLPGQPLLAATRPDGPPPGGLEQPANSPPNAIDDNLAAFPGVSQQLYVLDNDTDLDIYVANGWISGKSEDDL